MEILNCYSYSRWYSDMLSIFISGLLLLSDLADGNSFGDILMVLDQMWKGSYRVVKLSFQLHICTCWVKARRSIPQLFKITYFRRKNTIILSFYSGPGFAYEIKYRQAIITFYQETNFKDAIKKHLNGCFIGYQHEILDNCFLNTTPEKPVGLYCSKIGLYLH